MTSDNFIYSIQLFAKCREIAGVPEIKIEKKTQINIGQLIRDCIEVYPEFKDIPLIVAINCEYVTDNETLVSPFDEIALIPPIAGG